MLYLLASDLLIKMKIDDAVDAVPGTERRLNPFLVDECYIVAGCQIH